MFRLPASEKMILSSKCFLTTSDFKIEFRRKRARLILLNDHLVLDFAIFGPSITKNSILIRLEQLIEVYDSYDPSQPARHEPIGVYIYICIHEHIIYMHICIDLHTSYTHTLPVTNQLVICVCIYTRIYTYTCIY